MKILLIDRKPQLVEAWNELLNGRDNIEGIKIETLEGDIFQRPVDALVSPANSFGYMDGGIDLAYLNRFGFQIQEVVQARIMAEYDNELLVGQSFVVPTGDSDFPSLIVAPTMTWPAPILQLHDVRLAARAATRAAINSGFDTVAMPGLGTATGRVGPASAAAYMFMGIRDAVKLPRMPWSQEVRL